MKREEWSDLVIELCCQHNKLLMEGSTSNVHLPRQWIRTYNWIRARTSTDEELEDMLIIYACINYMHAHIHAHMQMHISHMNMHAHTHACTFTIMC